MNTTLNYYNTQATPFFEATSTVDFSSKQHMFLKYLQPAAYILDFGCGSGRDSKVFLEQDYQVDAWDGSPELCKLAESNIGQAVQNKLFQELSAIEVYDGIWACASILHLEKKDLVDVLAKMENALKRGGYLYISFKYGEFEGIRNGRYFTDMTEGSLSKLLMELTGLEIIETDITSDVRSGREEEKWLNAILKKVSMQVL